MVDVCVPLFLPPRVCYRKDLVFGPSLHWALYDEELNSKTETRETFLPCPLSYMESVRKKGPKRLRLGAGFYENRSWVSSQGRSWRSTKQVFMCLRNRTIYFHGDSTVRQWHEVFESALKMADPNTKRMSDSSRFRASFYSPHFNITTNFSFIEFPVSRANFSVNENQFGHRLDEIAQPEDVVLIGAGMAHRAFGGVVEGMKQVEYYTQLAKRCARRCASVSYKSSTFRGLNASQQERVGNAVFNSLYYFKERLLLHNVTDVMFIDTMDAFLPVADISGGGIHPPKWQVKLMVNWWLGKVANDGNLCEYQST